ncbi:MAG: hypothetical protein EON93_08905 [Burkholderiales bacterium]|nr:MAG: hypothetical protein EON93_08905 [Burkholderiales bacterium]
MGYAVRNPALNYTEALDEFNETETRLGELSAYLEVVADGLIHDPDGLLRVLRTEWPDLPALLKLRAKWIVQREAVITAWHALSAATRAANPLPPFGAADPTRPLV